MAKKTETKQFDLEALAVQLDGLATEADEAGEERTAKSIRNAAKSARWSEKQRAARLKRIGSTITAMQAKGMSADEIVTALTK
jgi:hypothetical protein